MKEVRSYGQYCALAKALDLVGERWTLVIVRELFVGPRRYVDLLHGIPGISTDMLAARLRTMEQNKLVVRRVPPPPVATALYELTPLGASLKGVVLALASWGLPLMEKQQDEEYRVHWSGLMLATMFQPAHAQGTPLQICFEVNGQKLNARIAEGKIEIGAAEASIPDVTVTTSASNLVAIAQQRQVRASRAHARPLRMRGSRAAIRRVRSALGMIP